MCFLQINELHRLTGQRPATLLYMNLTLSPNDPVVAADRRVGTVRGAKTASRILNYNITQLLNLSPAGQVVRNLPFAGEPPPHLLVGYYYVAAMLNSYLFDRRTFTNLSFDNVLVGFNRTRRMVWRLLCDCAYTVNVGRYTQMVTAESVDGENLRQAQNAIIMDRIVAPVRPREMRGEGIRAAIEGQRHNMGLANVTEAFLDRYREASVEPCDVALISVVNTIKLALINFVLLTRNANVEVELDLPLDDRWVERFIQHFSSRDVSCAGEAEDLMDVLGVVTSGRGALSGGALTLRSGRRVGLPFNLRPRAGDAVRRTGRRGVERFVDRLPRTTRRRRRAPVPREEAVEEDPGEGPSGIQEREERRPMSVQEFNDYIVNLFTDLIRRLEREVSEQYRGRFFDFTERFNRLLIRAINNEEMTPHFARRWITNFFIMEHLASTLYYLNTHLNVRSVAQYLGVDFVQIVMRARDDEGREMFSRVWLEQGVEGIERLYRRLVDDFLVVTERSEEMAFAAQEEREQLLMDMNFVENSGDVDDVIAQITINDELVDAVEISFRVKLTGVVAFGRNPRIMEAYERIFQRWREERAEAARFNVP